jgi:hypothetical protein
MVFRALFANLMKGQNLDAFTGVFKEHLETTLTAKV